MLPSKVAWKSHPDVLHATAGLTFQKQQVTSNFHQSRLILESSKCEWSLINGCIQNSKWYNVLGHREWHCLFCSRCMQLSRAWMTRVLGSLVWLGRRRSLRPWREVSRARRRNMLWCLLFHPVMSLCLTFHVFCYSCVPCSNLPHLPTLPAFSLGHIFICGFIIVSCCPKPSWFCVWFFYTTQGILFCCSCRRSLYVTGSRGVLHPANLPCQLGDHPQHQVLYPVLSSSRLMSNEDLSTSFL